MTPKATQKFVLPTINNRQQLPTRAPRGDFAVRMKFEVWKDLPNHPRQRDTKSHATAKHFREARGAKGAVAAELHQVTAAILDGQWYKVDGHTRTFHWENGELPLPKDGYLWVKVYEVRSREELNRLFMTFDNPQAAMRSYDVIFGSLREMDLPLKSDRLSRGHFKGALNYAIRGMAASRQPTAMPELDLGGAIEVYREELLILDEMSEKGMKREKFITGVLGAALIMTALYPETVEMWKALNEDEWVRKGKKSDAPGIISQYLMKHRGDDSKTRSVELNREIFGRTLHASYEWVKANAAGQEKWYERAPHTMEPFPLIEEVRKRKGYDYSPTLFQPTAALLREEPPLIPEVADPD